MPANTCAWRAFTSAAQKGQQPMSMQKARERRLLAGSRQLDRSLAPRLAGGSPVLRGGLLPALQPPRLLPLGLGLQARARHALWWCIYASACYLGCDPAYLRAFAALPWLRRLVELLRDPSGKPDRCLYEDAGFLCAICHIVSPWTRWIAEKYPIKTRKCGAPYPAVCCCNLLLHTRAAL